MPSNVGGLVYGTITVAALLAAERAQRETYPETVGAVLIAIALLWVAHAYAEYTAVSTGAKTFVVTGQRVVGTGTAHRIRAGASRPTFLTVTLLPV